VEVVVKAKSDNLRVEARKILDSIPGSKGSCGNSSNVAGSLGILNFDKMLKSS
jgi:hypothetical protein